MSDSSYCEYSLRSWAPFLAPDSGRIGSCSTMDMIVSFAKSIVQAEGIELGCNLYWNIVSSLEALYKLVADAMAVRIRRNASLGTILSTEHLTTRVWEDLVPRIVFYYSSERIHPWVIDPDWKDHIKLLYRARRDLSSNDSFTAALKDFYRLLREGLRSRLPSNAKRRDHLYISMTFSHMALFDPANYASEPEILDDHASPIVIRVPSMKRLKLDPDNQLSRPRSQLQFVNENSSSCFSNSQKSSKPLPSDGFPDGESQAEYCNEKSHIATPGIEARRDIPRSVLEDRGLVIPNGQTSLRLVHDESFLSHVGAVNDISQALIPNLSFGGDAVHNFESQQTVATDDPAPGVDDEDVSYLNSQTSRRTSFIENRVNWAIARMEESSPLSIRSNDAVNGLSMQRSSVLVGCSESSMGSFRASAEARAVVVESPCIRRTSRTRRRSVVADQQKRQQIHPVYPFVAQPRISHESGAVSISAAPKLDLRGLCPWISQCPYAIHWSPDCRADSFRNDSRFRTVIHLATKLQILPCSDRLRRLAVRSFVIGQMRQICPRLLDHWLIAQNLQDKFVEYRIEQTVIVPLNGDDGILVVMTSEAWQEFTTHLFAEMSSKRAIEFRETSAEFQVPGWHTFCDIVQFRDAIVDLNSDAASTGDERPPMEPSELKNLPSIPVESSEIALAVEEARLSHDAEPADERAPLYKSNAESDDPVDRDLSFDSAADTSQQTPDTIDCLLGLINL